MRLNFLNSPLRCFAPALLLTISVAAQDALPPPPSAPAPAKATPAHVDAKPPMAAGKTKKKSEYTGPNTVVELPPTPVLDGEGRQRLDPEGKPMFNAPVRQLRDKKGHPIFDDAGKPVFQTAKDLGYDEKGKKIEVKKEKEPKTVGINIVHGTFTVDGLTGKAALNYDIKDFKYVYLYVPWIGTTIVSNSPFPGSKEQKAAFNDKTLTVTVEEHTLQLYSDQRLLDKKPEPAYVLVDRDYKLPTRYPVVGYGPSARAPLRLARLERQQGSRRRQRLHPCHPGRHAPPAAPLPLPQRTDAHARPQAPPRRKCRSPTLRSHLQSDPRPTAHPRPTGVPQVVSRRCSYSPITPMLSAATWKYSLLNRPPRTPRKQQASPKPRAPFMTVPSS